MTPHQRIRQLFLEPQPTYGADECASLLACSHEEVITAIARGDLAVELPRTIPRVPWEEVAFAAAEKWPQELIEEALGVEAASVIPELVRLTDLHVRVPRFGVLALGRIAQREGTTVSEVIARQLLDLIAEQPDPLERSIAGLAGAMRWPLT
jgi:hypothetical protein